MSPRRPGKYLPFRCYDCGADVAQPCRTFSGNVSYSYHSSRHDQLNHSEIDPSVGALSAEIAAAPYIEDPSGEMITNMMSILAIYLDEIGSPEAAASVRERNAAVSADLARDQERAFARKKATYRTGIAPDGDRV